MQSVINVFKPNPKQQECIDAIKGQIMVLAGPGTGKTFTVIERIKNMLKNGIDGKKILCLTFSEAAASEMKKRLVEKTGSDGSKVNVYTYHSFCFELIQNNPEHFEEYSNSEIINDTHKRSLIKQCIDELSTTYFKTASGDSYFHTNTILQRIDEIKKNLLTKEEYFYNLKNHPDWQKGLDEALLEQKSTFEAGKKVTKKLEAHIKDFEKKIGQAQELWVFYELYGKKMQECGLIDFNDMISLVLKKFAHSASFLDIVAKDYDYFLVDEYQDTNKAQNSLVFSLLDAKEEKNIFVVGDDDQIIYAFQGAQIDNIEKFLEKYPKTKVICLDENMRSTQAILDLSEQVAKLDPRRLEANPKFRKYNICKHLTAKNEKIIQKEQMPTLSLYDDIAQEYNAVADKIERIITLEKPKKLNEIAILTKTNGELEEFAQVLKARNIPCELKEGKSVFSIKAAILTIFYLKMLYNPLQYSETVFPLLLSEPFSLNIHDYNDILAKSYLHKNRDFISDLYDMKEHPFIEPKKIQKFLSDYEYLKDAQSSLTLYRLVLEVINRTGILEYFVKNPHDTEENISGIKKIVDEAKDFSRAQKTAGLKEFIEYLDEIYANNTPLLAQKPPVEQNAVQLVTFHSSKGREFEYVFMPTMEQYKWERSKTDTISPKIPLSNIISEEDKEELKISEKIKLLFVGITRAKHSLHISMPKTIGGKQKKLTTFLNTIDGKYIKKQEISYTKENYTNELFKSLHYETDYKKEFENFIRSSIESLSISASMLNTYLKCPRQFFYTYILRLNPLTKIDDKMNYGNVIHKVLEDFSKKAKLKNSYPPIDELIEDFLAQCAKTPFSSRTSRNEFTKKGSENLKKFYPQLILTPLAKIFSTELNIEAKINTEIKINGKIDRLLLNDDGTFCVVDFKTGSAKKAYDIKPGGVYESYLNQLQFYKYLAEKKFENKVTGASLVFVEQCADNFHTPLNDCDNNEIEEKTKQVHTSICAQNFEPQKQDKNCKMCRYQSFCELNLL